MSQRKRLRSRSHSVALLLLLLLLLLSSVCYMGMNRFAAWGRQTFYSDSIEDAQDADGSIDRSVRSVHKVRDERTRLVHTFTRDSRERSWSDRLARRD